MIMASEATTFIHLPSENMEPQNLCVAGKSPAILTSANASMAMGTYSTAGRTTTDATASTDPDCKPCCTSKLGRFGKINQVAILPDVNTPACKTHAKAACSWLQLIVKRHGLYFYHWPPEIEPNLVPSAHLSPCTQEYQRIMSKRRRPEDSLQYKPDVLVAKSKDFYL